MRQIFAEQCDKLPVLVNQDTCAGKTYIVTGANNGLGLETARHLVGSSALRVILAVRNTTSGAAAKADIERTTGRTGVAEVWHLDLASFASVREFASKAEKELDRVDGLIENAGVMMDKWTVAEGMETSMTVNVVSTMLLAVLLMPVLMKSAKQHDIKPRVVFVVSGLGFQPAARKELVKGGQTNILEGLNNEKQQNMDSRYVYDKDQKKYEADSRPRYSLTKLVEMYAVRALAEACPFQKNNIIINMVAPGICSTGLGVDTRTFVRAAQGAIRAVLARTAEEGSRTILHALLQDESSHGKHLSGCKIKE
jgi:NAD(P)-dependent dehydrogenase (short-subunit alcohol dehydrogenase family)